MKNYIFLPKPWNIVNYKPWKSYSFYFSWDYDMGMGWIDFLESIGFKTVRTESLELFSFTADLAI